jgi:hypothetical protein
LLRDLNEVRSSLRRVVSNLPLYDIANENTPASISTDQNNYVPGNYDILRLNPTADITITGLRGGVKGRFLRIFNVGNFEISLSHQDTSSLPENRFVTPTGFTSIISSGEETVLYYDLTQERWITSYSTNADRISCQLRLTSAQSIGDADATYPAISWQTAVIDTGGFWNAGSPTIVTIPETGWYQINIHVVWDVNGTNLRETIIRNDTVGESLDFDSRLAVSAARTNISLNKLIYLPKGTTLSLRVWQNSGGPLDVSVDRPGAFAIFTEFNVVRA